MKTFKVSTSIQSHLGQGKMFLVSAENEAQVLAWFAVNYGLATIDQDSIVQATTEDTLYYQSTGGRVHQANERQRKALLSTLDAVDQAEAEAETQQIYNELQEAKNRKPTSEEMEAFFAEMAAKSAANFNPPLKLAEPAATQGTETPVTPSENKS